MVWGVNVNEGSPSTRRPPLSSGLLAQDDKNRLKFYGFCQMTMKKLWIIANWKSNKDLKEAIEWVEAVGPNLPKRDDLKVVVCPQFTELDEIKKTILVNNFPILVGSQDLSPFPEGAYTGEEAAEDLKQFISIAILGHSERRQNFGETDQLIEEKVQQAKEAGILPLVCVQSEDTPVPADCKLVAFEPIEAIGSGHPDTPQDADKVAQVLKQKYGQNLEVLYGGSVSAENAAAFIKQENINGLLIGHKALDAEEFVKIVENCINV